MEKIWLSQENASAAQSRSLSINRKKISRPFPVVAQVARRQAAQVRQSEGMSSSTEVSTAGCLAWIMPRDKAQVTGPIKEYIDDKTDSGKALTRYFCENCGAYMADHLNP